MRNICFFALALFFTAPIFSQSSTLIGKNFITKTDLQVKLYNYATKSIVSGGDKIFSRNWKFYVVDIVDNNLLIKQWDFNETGGKKEKEITKTELITIDGGVLAYARQESNNKFFLLDLKQFNDKCDPYFARGGDFIIGIMTIPVKLRAGNKEDRYFEFEEKFNLGISTGYKYSFNSRKDRSLSFLINASVSSARVDSINTGGYQLTGNSTACFTVGLGALYQQENINVGFFFGWDKIAGELGRNWKFNGRPWIGIGIGVALFNLDLSDTKQGKNK